MKKPKPRQSDRKQTRLLDPKELAQVTGGGKTGDDKADITGDFS